ncbi:FeoB-associated Cys-rich membrane protein [Aneurinibacillus terranovensis]|uniref:FeoB-associated Cys-rich membrane protein n=1 Tax=Aneurinibacillus terranovensis TaxID=278991 RepID=UPI00040014DD|nr:FeoB-associated Cys-rich membrane protein [Aneurinibacillus terranovensis]
MVFNILFGVLIFGYAGWTLVRFVKRSKEGKCAGCSLKKSCQAACETASAQVDLSTRYANPDVHSNEKYVENR